MKTKTFGNLDGENRSDSNQGSGYIAIFLPLISSFPKGKTQNLSRAIGEELYLSSNKHYDNDEKKNGNAVKTLI